MLAGAREGFMKWGKPGLKRVCVVARRSKKSWETRGEKKR